MNRSHIEVGWALTSAAGLPFAAVVGNARVKLALMLLAVDPQLKGVLITSGPGSGKSTLARGFESIWPRGPLPVRDNDFAARSTIVELPLNATADRLLGSLDLDRTLASSTRQVSDGLLARAHGRVLYVDDINLVEEGITHLISAALDGGVVRVEREALSITAPAEFVLVGTYNPEEGEVNGALRDRVGLIAEAGPPLSTELRSELVGRIRRYDDDPIGFVEEFSEYTAAIKSAITESRRRLSTVRLAKSTVRKLAEAALELGVEGNRADIFAARAAKASAALAGRKSASEDDINAAMRLVLDPRATVSSAERRFVEADRNRTRERERDGSRDEAAVDSATPESAPSDAAEFVQDLIIKAAESPIPKGVFASSTSGRGRATSGRRAMARAFTSGRYVGSTDRRPKTARIAVDATLRAAAPFQVARRGVQPSSVRGVGSSVQGANRRRAVLPESSRHVVIKPDDLRYKKFKRRSGTLFIFVVDASGSMALNRMAQAKGAMLRLLHDAYLHRDGVALVAFRGARADVLLAPTRSAALAKRVVDALPAGGGTPIAAGLIRALELARSARMRDGSQSTLLVFTDGRANVSLSASHESDASTQAWTIQEELTQIGAALQIERIESIVIDTKHEFASSGEGCALADALGGQYFYLPRAGATEVWSAVSSAAAHQRGKISFRGLR